MGQYRYVCCLTLPFVYPLIRKPLVLIYLVWFVSGYHVELGLITPPVGMNVLSLIGGPPIYSIGDMYKG